MENSIKGDLMAASKWMSKRTLFSLFRTLISVVLIGYLLARVNLEELFGLLNSWNALYFVVAVLLGVVRNLVFAYRWRVTLSVSGIEMPFLTLVKFYFVGGFFNLFLPTALGGDVVRGYDLATHSGDKMGAVTSVLMERIVGFFALAFIAVLALLMSTQEIRDASVTTLILFACLGYFMLTIVIFNARAMKKLLGLLQFIKIWDIGQRLDRTYNALYAFTAHKSILGQSFVLSVISQILAILAAYALAWAINLKLAPIYFFIALPMIWIVTMVPLSINGLGVREGAFVFFFTQVGVSNSGALMLSFLNFSQIIVLGLMGGIIYLIGQTRPIAVAPHKTREA